MLLLILTEIQSTRKRQLQPVYGRQQKLYRADKKPGSQRQAPREFFSEKCIKSRKFESRIERVKDMPQSALEERTAPVLALIRYSNSPAVDSKDTS